jgi:hypothetical protein
MRHQNRHHIHGLHSKSVDLKRGLFKRIAFGVLFALAGFVIFWQNDAISTFLTGSQPQIISDLREQNKILKAEVEHLKTLASDPTHQSNIAIKDLLKRIETIEQHQNALIEALKTQQPVKSKQSALEGIETNTQSDMTKLGLLNEHLGDIEYTHMKLAKTLTERSEKNTRMLTLMLASVSDRLVPQKLFGKAPTGSKQHLGGPFIPLLSNPVNKEGFNAHFPEIVTTAIETMQDHARLYNTLVSLPLARPLAGEAHFISGFGTRSDPFTRQPAFHAGIDLKQNPGAAILSTGNGIVIHAGQADGYGNMVEVAHADGVSTRYGHMSRISVSVGDPIRTGQILGALGNTGRSTGAHLHYETRVRDQAVNPIPFLQMGERLRILELGNAGKQM